MIDKTFWNNKKVFLTGHTGFKGSWLVLMLNHLGAKVAGYSHDIPTTPSMFELCNLSELLEEDIRDDILNLPKLQAAIERYSPDIVFHLAAQPLVRKSYSDPYETYSTNVMGTLNVLMSVLKCANLKTVVNITTDKCYENREWQKGYIEEDTLGGYDPYSSSKACAEILTASIRRSFYHANNISLCTVRSGNVIGGGDWAEDRIIPDFMRSLVQNKVLHLRNPGAIRPWQHVMEPLCGYIMLAEKSFNNSEYSEAWNFGPDDKDCKTVLNVIQIVKEKFPAHPGIVAQSDTKQPHEANFLKLDCSKAKKRLGWKPRLSIEEALQLTSEWYFAQFQKNDLRRITLSQIEGYLSK